MELEEVRVFDAIAAEIVAYQLAVKEWPDNTVTWFGGRHRYDIHVHDKADGRIEAKAGFKEHKRIDHGPARDVIGWMATASDELLPNADWLYLPTYIENRQKAEVKINDDFSMVVEVPAPDRVYIIPVDEVRRLFVRAVKLDGELGAGLNRYADEEQLERYRVRR